jgi:hypothetical protein
MNTNMHQWTWRFDLLFPLPYRPTRLAQQPSTALLFLLVVTLFLVGLELLLAECLAAALCLETAPIMAVCSCIYIEEGRHLPVALVFVIVHIRTGVGLLELACEAVEVGLRLVLLAVGCG